MTNTLVLIREPAGVYDQRFISVFKKATLQESCEKVLKQSSWITKSEMYVKFAVICVLPCIRILTEKSFPLKKKNRKTVSTRAVSLVL